MLKALGLILLFCVCVAAGQQKAMRIVKRKNALGCVCKGLNEMEARMRYGAYERDRLIKEAFSQGNILTVQDGDIVFLESGLYQEDEAALSELFSEFGRADTASEEGRIRLYKTLFEQKKQDFETEAAAAVKLYRTIGICAGAVVCLIFI